MMPACFLTPLDVRLVDDLANEGRGEWELLADFEYWSQVAARKIVAKKGERTDFASVPRQPLIYLLMGEKGRKAAVIHDHLYRTKELDREMADEVLKEALLVEGYTQEDADAFFFGVRVGGGAHYGFASPIAISSELSLGGALDNSA